MKHLYLTALICVATIAYSMHLFAQPNAQIADKQFESGDYERAALNYMDQLNEEASTAETKSKIAACYSYLNQASKAVDYYEDVIISGKMQPQDEFMYAHNLKKLGQYDKAKKWYTRYARYNESVGKHYAASCDQAKAITKQMENYLIFPSNFNSSQNEFGPCISPNGLIFNTISSTKGSEDCEYKLYKAEGEKASFEQPKALNDRFKDKRDIVFVDYSPSGKKVVYTKITDKSCFNGIVANNGMAIYEADVTNDGQWENDRALPFNTLGYKTAYASYGKTDDELLFCSDQPSGFGGFDIYKARRTDERKWSKSQNLGPSVNSEGDEIAPQWNGESLVFASNWHKGLGGFDIFYCDFVNGHFYEAVNPGRPLNSSRDDWNLVFVDHESGYFTTNRNMSQSGTDIYYFNALQKRATAEPIFTSEVRESSNESISVGVPVDWDESLYAELDKTDPENVKTVYTIQVAVLDKKNPNFGPFTNALGDIDAIYKVFYDEVVKVRVGSYEEELKAERTLEKVKARGYKDAFIVQEKMIIPTDNEGKPKKEFPKSYEEGQYKVRLATYMHPEYFQRNKVEEFGEIVKIEKDPYTIFLLGHYDEVFKAREVMEKVKKRGFTNAQIVTREGNVLHRIE